MRNVFSFFSCLLYFFIPSQGQQLYSKISLPKQIPPEYKFNYDSIYKAVSKKYIHNVSQSDVKRYAEIVVYDKEEVLTSGYVYLNWNKMEDYLNKVLLTILPDSLRNLHMHIYVTKYGEENAFTMYDGSIYVDVGLMANVTNEAALAIVLGHEVSHFLHNDPQNSFIKGLKVYSSKNRNRQFEYAVKKAHEDREQETQADLSGFKLAEAGGYDLYYGINNFYQFKELEDITHLKRSASRLKKDNDQIGFRKKNDEIKNKTLEELFATHPALEDRILFLQKFLDSKDRRENKTSFKVDKDLFYSLQAQAKYEYLNALLEQDDYKECIRASFSYYLLEPTDDNIIYYLMESLRKLMYSNYSYRDLPFLTDDNYSGHFAKDAGIMHDINYLIRDSVKMANIKVKELTDSTKIEFETYAQAFDYFSTIVLQRNIPEAVLSLGLYDLDSVKRIKYLKQYIQNPSAKFLDFAKAAMENQLYDQLSTNAKDLIIFDEIPFLSEGNAGVYRKISETKQNNKEIEDYLKLNIPEEKSRSLVFLNDLTYSDMKLKFDYWTSIVSASDIKNEDKKLSTYYGNVGKNPYSLREVDYFILNPEIWYFFKNNSLSSIRYMKFVDYDNTYSTSYVYMIDPKKLKKTKPVVIKETYDSKVTAKKCLSFIKE